MGWNRERARDAEVLERDLDHLRELAERDDLRPELRRAAKARLAEVERAKGG